MSRIKAGDKKIINGNSDVNQRKAGRKVKYYNVKDLLVDKTIPDSDGCLIFIGSTKNGYAKVSSFDPRARRGRDQ